MTDIDGLRLEGSTYSDFLGFELLLEEQDRELLSRVRVFMALDGVGFFHPVGARKIE